MCLTVLALYCSEFHCKALGFQHQQVHIQVFKRKENHETGPFGNINIYFFKTTQKWHKKSKKKQNKFHLGVGWGTCKALRFGFFWICILISASLLVVAFHSKLKKQLLLFFFRKAAANLMLDVLVSFGTFYFY